MRDELLDDLASFMADEYPWPDDPDETLPPPVDAEQANKLLHVVRRLSAERDEIVRVAESEKRRIDEWASDRTSGIERRVESIERALEGFTRHVNRETPKRKTLNFPNGTLRLRAARTSVRVFDESLLVEWARTNMPSLLTMKPNRTAIGKLAIKESDDQDASSSTIMHSVVSADGEIVPGVVVDKPRDDTFSLTPTKQEADADDND